MAPLGVDNALVEVADLGAALSHYQDVLGLQLRFRLSEPPLALLSIGDERPGLLIRQAAQPVTGGMRLWLEVADAREAAAELAGRGVNTLGEPFQVATGWTVEVADAWGNVVGLTDYTLRPELGRSTSAL
ncbi:MAG: VOC family protein [Chloroflexi bacterium]|nr:VOC family protein [Chloroflexota bacterium]